MDLAGDASDETGAIRSAISARFRLDLESSGCICQAFEVSTSSWASEQTSQARSVTQRRRDYLWTFAIEQH